jgi:hypothetical protein
MPRLKAPLRDIRFGPHEVFNAPSLWARLPALAETVDGDTADVLFGVAASVSGQLIALVNRSGVEEGAQRRDGIVINCAGSKRTYNTHIEGGRLGLYGNRSLLPPYKEYPR